MQCKFSVSRRLSRANTRSILAFSVSCNTQMLSLLASMKHVLVDKRSEVPRAVAMKSWI
jgi:hypothetical protein